jgi:protein arginine kinase activator
MKCEICGLKDAVIHIRQIQKEMVHELHICEDCAQEKGLIREEESELPIANLLSGLLEGKDVAGAASGRESCPKCGMKATDFRRQGKLGCTECFTAFEKDVRAIVSQMAARPRHTGKVPAALAADAASPSEGLRDELRAAVEREDYEAAAGLRDRIRDLEAVQEGEAAARLADILSMGTPRDDAPDDAPEGRDGV